MIFKLIKTIFMKPPSTTPEPILNRLGHVVAYFDGRILLDDHANELARCESGNILSEEKIIGLHRNGLFLDKEGRVVAFEVGAIGAPHIYSGRNLPITSMGAPSRLPFPPPRQGWSSKSWESFLRDGD
jgi:hypothetical protein